MSERSPLICKVGGSLLGWPELFPRLTGYLKSEQRPVALIVGGGRVADVVRDWDNQLKLGDETAHWLGIRAMRLGEALVHSQIAQSIVVQSHAEALRAWDAGAVPILNVEFWLQNEPQAADIAIPHNWSVTSDSIAAAVARNWDADLLLCKSTTPEQGGESFVDLLFEKFARGLRVNWWEVRSNMRGLWNPPTLREPPSFP